MKSVLERLELYLQEKNGATVTGNYLPRIRFFDGTVSFSDAAGNHKFKTLEESLDSFLKTKGY
jgi:hypothetical protein